VPRIAVQNSISLKGLGPTSSKAVSDPSATPVRYVKGVGPKLATLLQTRGIETMGDLIHCLPSRYLDRSLITPIKELEEGSDHTVIGEVTAANVMYARRRRIAQVSLSDGSGHLFLKWFYFNASLHQSRFKKGVRILVSGKVSRYRRQWQMVHPDIEVLDSDAGEGLFDAPGIVPLYPSIPHIGQKYLKRIISTALHACLATMKDPFDQGFLERHRLMALPAALRFLHAPPEGSSVELLSSGKSPAHRRLIFGEFFFLELGLCIRRQRVMKERGIRISITEQQRHRHLASLPFQLTGAQQKVLHAVDRDFGKAHPMNRLIQGDVGSGKTVVAFLAALAVMEQGYQVAVMAPTEILAFQHFQNFRRLLGDKASQVGLLTASIAAKEKKWLRLCVQEGRLPLLVGTHALLNEGLSFKQLGLVVIDEQHRFGVMQRKLLRAKACDQGVPHVLVMTATPIPRTLAMTVYGELDVSVIDELPPGRQPVTTRVIGERQRRQMYESIRAHVDRGEQVYIVYPLVEETEKSDLKAATEMAQKLQQEVFPQCRIALLHGRMRADEKASVMNAFKDGDVPILVTTTVIEVGVDVPNATCMVIEHPERFGLSQLHQLRGRIGRGQRSSLCLLVASTKQSGEGRKRLAVMESTQDGFRVAEADLEIRGPGEFLGTRQSGLPDLKFANLVRDVPILSEARDAAFDILAKDPLLTRYHKLRKVLKEQWAHKLSLADIG
jgi:ATP-dependent DNA helicase RecG